MKIIEVEDKELEKMKELGIEFRERFCHIELFVESLVRESIATIESDGDYEEEMVAKVKPRANDIAAEIYDDMFVNGNENDATYAVDTLFDIANSAVCAELKTYKTEKEILGITDYPQVNQDGTDVKLKVKAGDKVEIIENVAYGSIFGVIKIAKGTILTVKERNGSNDGINAEETITFENEWLGTTVMPYAVWDWQYVVLK